MNTIHTRCPLCDALELDRKTGICGNCKHDIQYQCDVEDR